nr:outer-membrane lipoprotein LolB-like [Nerophis lumbriciformis]
MSGLMRRLPIHVILLALSVLLLSGCANKFFQPEAADTDTWSTRQATLQALQNWDVSGRIAVINGNENWQASLRWKQHLETYAIDLIGPLGQGRVDIRGTAEAVTLRTAKQSFTASDADSLLEQATGLRLPLNGLRYWLRGLPEPGQEQKVSLDRKQLLRQLKQSGWLIDYHNYIQVDQLDLPKRITATQDDIAVKLIVSKWTL